MIRKSEHYSAEPLEFAECPRCHGDMSPAEDAICDSLSCRKFRAWAAEQPQDEDETECL